MSITIDQGYKGNALLKKAGIPTAFTKDQLDEFIKCSNDPIYFIEKYLKVIDADKGLISIDLRKYQKKMVSSFHRKRRTIVTTCRRAGKSTAVCGYILWYIIFNNDKTVALLANKGETARELLGLIQLGYKNLPYWIQQGIVEFNKGSFVLENNSRVIATATSSDAIRGYTISLLYIDECAFIENWEAFSASVLPTITSGKETKIVLVSTPNGMNFYYKLWHDALENKNGYSPIIVRWQEVPGNDEKWYKETLETLGNDIRKFNQEYEVEFLGSTNTLISALKLQSLVAQNPLSTNDNLYVYSEPEKKHTYTICVDVSEGLGKDYSTFSVIDVTEIPYKQVARYKNNEITPYLLPTVILQIAKKYNNAFVLVEINTIGLQVADTLHYELAYENLIKIQIKGKLGQQHSAGFARKIALGLKISPQTKRIGCANLKALIENDKLIINDLDTILELTTFSMKNNTYKAEEGHTDDLVMTLVHFGWLTGQKYFKEEIGSDIRRNLQEEQLRIMDSDLIPFGIIDGHQGYAGPDDVIDDQGERWVADRERIYAFDNFNYDWRSKW